ncbi:M17 family metallopeptidase [Glaciecola siphonariae]|uniref:M17 family metallopeptidase n=1 Tax=Glaciecola siphonariae TaxID=521012 RepID=A0ABV9LYM6_9ALTE
MAFPLPIAVKAIQASDTQHDLSIIIGQSLSSKVFPALTPILLDVKQYDPRVGIEPVLMPADTLPGGRCLFVPSGELDRDYDDVRRFFDIGKAIAKQLVHIDALNPLVVLELDEENLLHDAQYRYALENVYLGMCQQLWQPLEARQALNEDDIEPVQSVGLYGLKDSDVMMLRAMEEAKRLTRDLCGTEPERMAPIGFASYCQDTFADSQVKVEIIDDIEAMRAEYPCLYAVARASLDVSRHHPRVINLTYEGEGPIEQTLFLAGKGITYDTGGADLKVGGHMAGMSRDKGGAAAVAGILKAVQLLKPKGLRVYASIAAVRNSIGADAYVPDEIITSHAGIRVRVGNTDAEGRMVLTDILSHMREQAQMSVSPQLFSFATLTGHAAVAFGPYTALMENKPALLENVSQNIIEAGHLWSDPSEQSLVRREDYDFIKPRTKADDVLSSNNAPSVSTVRGHQFPMAYLSIASGLDKHDARSHLPLPYTHVDIAGSAVENLDWQHGKPTAASVSAFVASYILPRIHTSSSAENEH